MDDEDTTNSIMISSTMEDNTPQNNVIPTSNSTSQDEEDIRNTALHKASRGALSVRQDTTQGSFVVANRTLQPGEALVECPSASIALDPVYRYTHCGFCASPIQPKPFSNSTTNNTTTTTTTTEEEEEEVKRPSPAASTTNNDTTTPGTPCQDCQIVTICHNCHDHGVTEWHSQSGECRILRTLVESFQQVFSEFEGLSFAVAAQNVESIYVLTMRLLNRRQQPNQQQTMIGSLPDINWKLFDSLYASPLPSSAGASSIVTAMATLLQTMQAKLQQQQKKNQQTITVALSLDPQTCISIWNKCRGCCHAITDLSRPLGAQNLGMALFVPQSFYNHECAPNAFLSCLLVSGKEAMDEQTNGGLITSMATSDHQCAVISRVVCCSQQALETGESVTLSYIPLSGLCRAERRMRLREAYHFACQCKLCRDIATVGSEGCVLEQHVGGEFVDDNQQDEDRIMSTLGPLRELQIECYQNLAQASKMEILNIKISDGADDDVDDGGEEDPRMDLIEQSISTLQMAQRGIRNHKIMASHEVSLECHRLLAVAYSLLRKGGKEGREEAIQNELDHHRQFFQGVEPAQCLLDPSAMTIQHSLMVECLRAEMEIENDATGSSSGSSLDKQSAKTQFEHHVATAKKIAGTALGRDHPFAVLQGVQLDKLFSPILSKKRKLAT